MIEDRVTALEAETRRLKERFEHMWQSFKTWEGSSKDGIASRAREQAAKIAEGCQEEDYDNMPPSWNDACAYIAAQIRKASQ